MRRAIRPSASGQDATNSYWSFAHLYDFSEEFAWPLTSFAIVACLPRVSLAQRVNPMKTVRHPPSRELWRFCMDRLRELRGPDTRERDLANILGFEHSRAVRWKEGQMYVDRAEYLVRLADALEVDTTLLVGLAAGSLSVEQAQRQLQRVGRGGTDDIRKRKGIVPMAAPKVPDP